ncbi:MAG: efflux RND transporter periplasmic adaptor subunit [Aeromonadaceae bacterium]
MMPFALLRKHPIVTVASLLVAAGVIYLLLPPKVQTDPQPSTTSRAALTVTVTTPRHETWPLQVSANGNITAWQEAIVGSEIGGLRLVEVLANVGDRVQKGQLLARLQQDSVAAELAQTRANLAEAQANLQDARGNANRARRIQSKGAVSEQQASAYITAELSAQARVDALKARLQNDTLRLNQTRILAPDSGTITARHATLGAVLQTGDELYRMIRGDRLEWRAELPAAELTQIRPGMRVSLTTPDGTQLQGRVRTVAPTLDPQTRNGLVYVDLASRNSARAGMFAQGDIQLGSQRLLTLPQAAVLLRDGFHFIFLLNDQGELVQRKVVVGPRQGDAIAILEGVKADEQVVDSGVGFLTDGDRVKVVATALTSRQGS